MDPSSMMLPHKNVPKRDMPRTSIIPEMSESSDQHHVRFQEEQPSASRQPTVSSASGAPPAFGSVDFTATQPPEIEEEVLSPTAHVREEILSPTTRATSDLA